MSVTPWSIAWPHSPAFPEPEEGKAVGWGPEGALANISAGGNGEIPGTGPVSSLTTGEMGPALVTEGGDLNLWVRGGDEWSPPRVSVGPTEGATGDPTPLGQGPEIRLYVFNSDGSRVQVGGIGTSFIDDNHGITNILGASGDRNFRFVFEEAVAEPFYALVLGPLADSYEGAPSPDLVGGGGLKSTASEVIVYATERALRLSAPETIDLDAPTLVSQGSPVGRQVAAPATATSPGEPGDFACDGSFAYFCTATDTWVRSPVSTW